MTSTVSSSVEPTVAPARRPPSATTRFVKFILSWPGVILVNAIIFTIFGLARLGGGNSPEIFALGWLHLRWYGLFIMTGVVLAALIAQYLAERKGEKADHVWQMLPVVLLGGIVGARIWFVVNTWDSFKDEPARLFGFSGGQFIGIQGIAIQGAVVGGILGGWLYCAFAKIKFWRWADIIAPGLILAQAVGRWGNFMNNEAYGRATNKPWGIAIPCQYRTGANGGLQPGSDSTACNTYADSSQLFHPTFFYESIFNYSVFITLFWTITHPKKTERFLRRIPFLRNFVLRDGDIFCGYLILYSVGRFFIESLRTDSLYLFGNRDLFRTAQALALIGLVLGIALLVFRHLRDAQLVAAADVPVEARPESATQLASRKARRAGSVVAQSATRAESLLEEPAIVEKDAPIRSRHYGAVTGSAVPGSKGGKAPAPTRVRARATTSDAVKTTAAGDGSVSLTDGPVLIDAASMSDTSEVASSAIASEAEEVQRVATPSDAPATEIETEKRALG